ncbi:MAG: exported protein of unknown function [Pedosphaera sp.]|nr:exported protein of unknown function [Pedosphaera sp.]
MFAVDAQTNVYAFTNGTVIKLSSTGAALQTNAICPLPGLAQRDAAGNFYFAGLYSGTQDFGGASLTNGTGVGPCFLAKYTSTGTLVWVRGFGPPGFYYGGIINVGALEVESSGIAYVGYSYAISTFGSRSIVTRYDAAGINTWQQELPDPGASSTQATVRLGAVSQTNGYAIVYGYISGLGAKSGLSRFDSTSATDISLYGFPYYPPPPLGARPIGNSLGEVYNIQNSQLIKRDGSGASLWTQGVSSLWTAASDFLGGVYSATDDGQLSRHDSYGNLIWTMSLPASLASMAVDAVGNRFITMSDGVVARLGSEIISTPTITNAPQGQTVLVGDGATIGVGASGSVPLRYAWLYQGNAISGATNSTYNLANITASQAGLYSVIVSNFAGSVTSAPALLRVKSVEIYLGGQALTNGTYVFPGPQTITIRSAYTNGSSFYTLDGSSPSFASTFYSAPFTLSHSATIRALGYSSDFSQSEEADAVNATILIQHSLSTSASGGGSVSLNPPGGTYFSTNTVTATATPAAGWQFLYWQGDVPAGAGSSTVIATDRNKTIRAIFGTTLATTVTGNGTVQLDPPGGVYPYGAVIRLTAMPQAGNLFGFWGNAATGNTNPISFTLTNANPTVSSIFSATPGGQGALTVQVTGRGQVGVNPRANAYTIGQTVTLTAQPDAGQSFVNWSGDASGTINPLNVSMNQAKVIVANFTSRPSLRVDRPGLEGLTPEGFRLTLLSDAQSVFMIQASTNLTFWETVATVTNTYGEAQFTDPGASSSSHRFYKAIP